jgi:CRISPR-associated protein Csa5
LFIFKLRSDEKAFIGFLRSVIMEFAKDIAEVLAVLIAEKGNYTYVDKLGYAPSKDLAIYYIREALRDLHSLINSQRWENSKAKEKADKINFDRVERGIQDLAKLDPKDKKKLREVTALISAKALSISATLIKEG